MCEAFAGGDVMHRIGIAASGRGFQLALTKLRKVGSGLHCTRSGAHSAVCSVCLKLPDDPALVLGEGRLQHMYQIDLHVVPRFKTRTAQDCLPRD